MFPGQSTVPFFPVSLLPPMNAKGKGRRRKAGRPDSSGPGRTALDCNDGASRAATTQICTNPSSPQALSAFPLFSKSLPPSLNPSLLPLIPYLIFPTSVLGSREEGKQGKRGNRTFSDPVDRGRDTPDQEATPLNGLRGQGGGCAASFERLTVSWGYFRWYSLRTRTSALPFSPFSRFPLIPPFFP